MARARWAPRLEIPEKEIIAVEHPMIIKELDSALDTFGTALPYRGIMFADPNNGSIPLYLEPSNQLCEPVLSHNSPTNNLLLKITVPRRTGRKRKRGSQDPYVEDGSRCNVGEEVANSELRSHSRLDKPQQLLRSLEDSQGSYDVAVVGMIDQTHRFRGLADFHQTMAGNKFMDRFGPAIRPGYPEQIREYVESASSRRDQSPGEDVLPPPSFAGHPLPFNWGYHQNPNIHTRINEETGETLLINKSHNKNLDTVYLKFDCKPEDIPRGPPFCIEGDPTLERFVKKLQVVMEKRPIWTRRSLHNQVAREPGLYMIKQAMQYVGYQFQSGPFRDAVIRFGLDPRTDKSYRIYQTVWFKLYEKDETESNTWFDKRSEYVKRRMDPSLDQTHIFDGKKVEVDGKIWQLCDITDPLLANLIATDNLRNEYEPVSDGWYCNGTWAKIKAIMKTKLLAIRAHRPLDEVEFKDALVIPDHIEGRLSREIRVPVPDVRLTQEEYDELLAIGLVSEVKGRGIKQEKSKRTDWARRRNEAKAAVEQVMARNFGEVALNNASKRITNTEDEVEGLALERNLDRNSAQEKTTHGISSEKSAQKTPNLTSTGKKRGRPKKVQLQ